MSVAFTESSIKMISSQAWKLTGGMSVHFRDIISAKFDDIAKAYHKIIYLCFSADLFEGDMLFPISSKPGDVS